MTSAEFPTRCTSLCSPTSVALRSWGLHGSGDIRSSVTVVGSGTAGQRDSWPFRSPIPAGGCSGLLGRGEKREYVAVLGADATIDYENDNVSAALGRLSPDGVDLFFNNIGVSLLDAILLKLAVGSLLVACGAMPQYDVAAPEVLCGVKNLQLLMFRRARIEGCVVPQFADR